MNARLERVRRIAYWMDSGIPVPFTDRRIGLDPIIGLVPGAGDSAGAVVGAWILMEAARLGVPPATLLRITGNIAADALVGTVPLLGDLFDMTWKANTRNVALIDRHFADAPAARAADGRLVAALIGGVLLLGVGLGVGSVYLGALIIRAFTG